MTTERYTAREVERDRAEEVERLWNSIREMKSRATVARELLREAQHALEKAGIEKDLQDGLSAFVKEQTYRPTMYDSMIKDLERNDKIFREIAAMCGYEVPEGSCTGCPRDDWEIALDAVREMVKGKS